MARPDERIAWKSPAKSSPIFKNKKPPPLMWKKLSAREREVLDLVVRGLSNKEIIGRPGITIEGVRWHLRNIYEKLQIHSRTEVLVKFRSDHNSTLVYFPKFPA
jgi:DNA-binding CsgD family transcriptional regulator